MNELDSQLIVGQLELLGWSRVDQEGEAELLIFNTCSVRDLAERKVMGKIGQLGRKRKRQIVGIVGCMAMSKKGELLRKLPNLDFVLGTNNLTDLPMVLDHVIQTGKTQVLTDPHPTGSLDYSLAKRDHHVKAYVSIIRGCNKFCTYCIVPYTRGREVSRPPEEIVEECTILAKRGYREITLLGQNVNSYGKDQKGWHVLFPDLLYRLDKIEGIKRIRFLTSHPVDITIELMEAIRDLPSLCEFVHFPAQSGSNRILKRMHRLYTREEYLQKCWQLREIIREGSIGTDMIVGFPTETEEDFQESCTLFKEIGYQVAFLYTYSPRKGTPAMRWGDDVPCSVKEERLQRLMALHEEFSNRHLERMLHKEVEVLIERKNREGWLYGRTRRWEKVIFPGEDEKIGTLQRVHIDSYRHQTLIGHLVPVPSFPSLPSS